MRIKNFFSCVCAAAIAALSLVGCSDYDNGYTEQQLKFIQGFKDVFGEIDHTNDWNLAERGTVTVTTSQPSRIKIYANTFGTYKIVGDYEGVDGTQTLGFDIVEGTTDILVSDEHTSQKAKVGDAVVFAGTRYVYENDNEIVKLGDIYGNTDWVFFDKEKYVDIVTSEDYGHLPEGIENLGKVTQNFSYISQGPFTIYPIFMQSASFHILGVYWKEGDGDDAVFKTQRVYRNNGEYTPSSEWGPHPKTWEDSRNGYDSKPITIDLPVGTLFGFFLEVYDEKSRNNGFDYNETENWYIDGVLHFPNERDLYGDKYLSHCVYSTAKRNEDRKGQPLDRDTSVASNVFNLMNGNKTAWAGTFVTTIINDDNEEEEVGYLGFEDWASDVFDLNDLVFLMKGNPLPIIIDEDPTFWVLSWEDLGGTFDIDYNDVVIKVGHVAGQPDLDLIPLAAGGTLASFLYYNDGMGDADECLGEIHSFFGQETGRKSGTYTPVNVDINKGEPEKEANIDIDIPKVAPTWSLSSFTPTTHLANRTELEALKNTMGGFYIKVVPEGQDGTKENADELPNKQKIQNIPIATEENVPYVICTPYNWRRTEKGQVSTGTYRWPREHVPMLPLKEDASNNDVAYTGYGDISRSFQAWVGGRQFEGGKHLQTSIYWYRYPNVEKTVGDTTPTSSGGGSSSGGVEDETKENPHFELTSQIPSPFTVTNSHALQYKYDGMEENDGRTVTITSSDEDVMSCDGNTITAKKKGTVTITLSLSGTDKYSAATIEIIINVELKDAKFLVGQEWEYLGASTSYEVELNPEQTHKIILCGNNEPAGINDNVTYSSSDERVATVSADGVITAKNIGEVTITVTSKETDVYASKTAYVYVTVVEEDRTKLGDDITEDVGEGSQESEHHPIIYTISDEIFKKYASDVTLSFYVDLSKFQNNLTCAGKIGSNQIYYNWTDQQPNNPLQITLTEERLADAKTQGMTIECNLPISDIYIKGTPAAAKRRIANRR